MTASEQSYMWMLSLVSLFLNSLAIQLLACNEGTFKYKKYAYIVGLAAQPYWIVMFIKSDNIFMLVICLLNTYGWFRGTLNHSLPKINNS